MSSEASISGKKITMTKNGVIGRYIIEEKLNIVEIEETTGAQLTYEVKSRDGENLQVLVTVKDIENGLRTIEYNDGHIQQANGLKSVSRDCILQLGVEYKVKITSKNGEEKTETILINDYYHTIIKNLGEGINIDNTAVKAAYNKPYQATITAENEYILETLKVTMGGQDVTVDKTTGIINIEKVTGDITITATAKKLEVQITNLIIGTSNPPTSSVSDNSQTRGDKLYINFNAILEGVECTVTPAIPYEITTNGKYIFTANGIHNGITITQNIEIQVNKYKSAAGLVKYDAGDWTQDEIEKLKDNKLYELNSNYNTSSIFKLNNETGFNFTFGGFTYKGDNANAEAIKDGTIITSRNQSVANITGTPEYEGWQILQSRQENGKTYVSKLIHTGTPENFVFDWTAIYDSWRAVYLLSSGKIETSYNILSNGTKINARNWDMYKDQKQLNLIKNVHCITMEEIGGILGTDIANVGTNNYWITEHSDNDNLWRVIGNGGKLYGSVEDCFGIRPVVELNEGVYISSGTGTESDPYVLDKE